MEMDLTFVGGEEEKSSRTQTETKAMIAVAGRRARHRMHPDAVHPDGAAERLMPFIDDFVEPGSVVHTGG